MKPIYLLDTCILSEVVKPVPDARVIQKLRELEDYCAISMITWSELWYGINLMPECRKKDMLRSFAIDKVQSAFPIIPQDQHSGLILADLRAKEKQTGTIHQVLDLQLASTAIANNLILVTHNTKDFQNIDSLMIEDWMC